MAQTILLLSIILQLAAAAMAGMMGWLRMRPAWFLIALAVALMTLRRIISFHGALLLGKEIDLAAESVAFLISLLLLVGIALLLMAKPLPAVPPGYGRVQRWNPGAVAGILAFLIISSTAFIAYQTFKVSKQAVVDGITSANERMAKSLALIGDSLQDTIPFQQRIAILEDIWERNHTAQDGGYVCIVDSAGKLVSHTAEPNTRGDYVGQNTVHGEALGFNNIDDLIVAKTDWGGWYVSSHGQSQIAAFAYSPALQSLVAVHVPANAVDREVLRMARSKA